jgi:His-Xaa-Ser system protein HxsD
VVEVTFAQEVARLSAVKKAAYRLAALCDVDIRSTPAGTRCELHATADTSGPELVALFRATVLDYELREDIAAKTSAFRDGLLAVAFAPLTRRDAEDGKV